MPSGYTAAVQDGKATELKDYAAACARAFGAFIHMRDDGDVELRYPDPERYAENAYMKARMDRQAWQNMDESMKYAQWSRYYREAVAAQHQSRSKSSISRGRYEAMLAQLAKIDVPSELNNYHEFMVTQLNDSIDFDCTDIADSDYMKPKEFFAWCDAKEETHARDVEIYFKRMNEDNERYRSAIKFIDLMADTYGFKVNRR